MICRGCKKIITDSDEYFLLLTFVFCNSICLSTNFTIDEIKQLYNK